MKFRKKPIVIEAVQFRASPLSIAECEEFVGGDMGGTAADPVIATLEGPMHVSLGDWIIKGVQGEFYPCKPDIFEQTYEPVEDDQ